MTDLRREPLSPAMPIRLPMPVYKFLINKAEKEDVKTQKGNLNPIPFIVEKVIECYEDGWENQKILVSLSEGIMKEDIAKDKDAMYDALCNAIERYSHNGLEFYLKEATKIKNKK